MERRSGRSSDARHAKLSFDAPDPGSPSGRAPILRSFSLIGAGHFAHVLAGNTREIELAPGKGPMGTRRWILALIAALGLPTGFNASAQTEGAQAVAVKPVPGWYVHGVATALLDPTPGMLAQIIELPRAADAFGAIARRDPDRGTALADALLKLSPGGGRIQPLAAAALAAVTPNDPDQRKAIVDVLLKLAASRDDDVAQSAVAALATATPNDPDQRKATVDAMLKLIAGTDLTGQSEAVVLTALTQNDPSQRKAVVDALLKLGTSSSWWVQQKVAESLAAVTQNDPDQRRVVIYELLMRAAIPTHDYQQFAAVALGVVAENDPVHRSAAAGALLKLAASPDTDIQRRAAEALGKVKPTDPDQRKAAADSLLTLFASSDQYVRATAAAALAAVNSTNPDQRLIAIDALVKFATGPLDEFAQVSAAHGLAAVAKNEPDHRKVAVEGLIRLIQSPDWYVQAAAASVLAQVANEISTQRSTVVDALLKLVASPETAVQRWVAPALAAYNPTDPDQRMAVVDALLTLVGSSDRHVQRSAADALFAIGPLSADEVVHLLTLLDQDAAQSTPKWRAMGWAFNGAAPMANDGAILMTFVGRPAAIPGDRWPKDPKGAEPILGLFARYWPKFEGSKSLQIEIAAQSNAIVSRACPAATFHSGAGVLETAAAHVAQEWDRTVAWLRGWLGARDSSRCWQGDGLATIKSLRDEFARADGFSVYARELDGSIAADGATPIFGQGILASSAWALLWTAFLAVFPYSARVRSAYLFNEKARGWLSLGALPVIMILLPFLRRRMLLPFRDELLAEAYLALLKDDEFYPGLRVRDRDGNIRPIGEAIPDIRGKLLLTGESGLGKSTYLRILASRTRGTIAYLSARSCDKGVEAAIVERVSGFESSDFFKGLIYSGDLAIVIDGLNEVTADVRAQIIAFVNGAGRANLVVATQPIEGIGGDRSPLTRAAHYELLPLAREDIAKFLKSRPQRDNPTSAVRGEDYDRAVDRLLGKVLDRRLQSRAEREAEQVLQEGRAAELILSNPMDLTYGSELIAMGQTPQPSQFIAQTFRIACARYRATHDRDFPILDFARRAVALRREDRNWLKADEFPNEQGVLTEFRLIVPRAMSETADKQVMVMRFRHEKVMDVLSKRAFDVDEELQVELVDDPRFRGVYLLFAQVADRALARRIRDRLVSRAAKTGDNGLSNEFVRLFDRGPVEFADAEG
jgi:HEAT repeat protein